MRPILRRGALATVGAGVAAAVMLGSSTASFAAVTTPIVNTTNQAGYQVGNNAYRFRLVQGQMTLPLVSQCTNGNYRNSGIQLITSTGNSFAVGAECGTGGYAVGYRFGYPGNTFPALGILATVAGGDQIFMQLYYDQTTNFVHVTAVDKTTNTTLVSTAVTAGAAAYKQAVLSADVQNPLGTPPPPGSNYVLVPFTNGAVTTYGGLRGTGINGPWGVQEEQAVSGSLVIAAAPLLFKSDSQFNVRIYGH